MDNDLKQWRDPLFVQTAVIGPGFGTDDDVENEGDDDDCVLTHADTYTFDLTCILTSLFAASLHRLI